MHSPSILMWYTEKTAMARPAIAHNTRSLLFWKVDSSIYLSTSFGLLNLNIEKVDPSVYYAGYGREKNIYFINNLILIKTSWYSNFSLLCIGMLCEYYVNSQCMTGAIRLMTIHYYKNTDHTRNTCYVLHRQYKWDRQHIEQSHTE